MTLLLTFLLVLSVVKLVYDLAKLIIMFFYNVVFKFNKYDHIINMLAIAYIITIIICGI